MSFFGLKTKLSSSLIALGSLFHSDGAVPVKAVFFIFMDGGTNRSSELDRRLYMKKFLT